MDEIELVLERPFLFRVVHFKLDVGRNPMSFEQWWLIIIDEIWDNVPCRLRWA